MILIKVSHKEGVEVIKKGKYNELSTLMDSLIIEYENNELMLIEDKIVPFNSRTCDFATTKDGWNCALIIAEGQAKLSI
jgi:hypothetical protein|tara:strand:+ start:370 stop:606 length:237 start_codon:yes stop_codon:yes gene_type:complete